MARERIDHEPETVRDNAGAVLWIVHQCSIERLARRATAPAGYDWLYGWRRKADDKPFDLYTRREMP